MTLLFDIYPAIGHLNASFALANQWRERQHRVVYCAVEAEHKKIIETKGFECIMLDYPLESDKQELRVKGLRFIGECFSSVFTQKRKHAFFREIADWENRITSLSPDRVYLDAQCALRTALYHKLGIPVVLVETMPLSLYDPWVPPFTSGLIPKQTSISRLGIRLAWEKIVIVRKIRNLFFSMLLCRQDYFSLYKRLFLECGFPFEEKIDWRRPFIIGIKESKILSMNPSSLDFPRKYPPNCQYAPSRVDLTREDPMLNQRYARVMEEVCLQKQQRPDIKIIYCFSSTVILPCPSNLYVFQQVPQLHLLSYCDLMITSGGMNSIAECIEKEVPMLVCPLSLKSDQLGNSARVVYHGLGLRARIKLDSSRTIEKRIVQLFENYATFKRNLSMMRTKILAESTAINTEVI